ncbi:hypothetical protein [Paraferrimonas haliotis]|uniref:Uncharacterized protein n=1 Tax=Paraferrimonas haliotis TaxID=2013866 RepID=A0AA37WY17_9GAMM|nr:hypothetical protein [Paraferrimonas haliotis]GLS82401.1 hypothetical protein GCM10007894_03780 [Paraferrimonas haliotis]
MTVMKSELIKLLDFPRQKMTASMELHQCAHNGFFDETDIRCRTCYQGGECTWVNHNDKLVALEDKTLSDLTAQIVLAMDFIDATLEPEHEYQLKCQCDNCSWLTQANNALRALDQSEANSN